MPIDLEELRRKLAQEDSSMDDLPAQVRLLCPTDLDPQETEDIAAKARLDGGSSDVIVSELLERGYLGDSQRRPVLITPGGGGPVYGAIASGTLPTRSSWVPPSQSVAGAVAGEAATPAGTGLEEVDFGIPTFLRKQKD